MKLGIVKEVKDHENRVALSPKSVERLTDQNIEVIVTKDAGLGVDYSNEGYQKSGAKILDNNKQVYQQADIIVKVKEPQKDEVEFLQENQILFSYLHLAAEKALIKSLQARNMHAIAFETVTDEDGNLPLLEPMSEIAGKLAVQNGAYFLQSNNNGKGVLLSGAENIDPAKVVIIGGGTVGINAAKVAVGMGAEVVLLEKDQARINELELLFENKVKLLISNQKNIEKNIIDCDLLVGAVLIPAAEAPKVVTKEMVKRMQRGSVIVDVAIDQGGCIETSKPTTHSDPVFDEFGVMHYCVTNIPAAAAKTASQALEARIYPYVEKLALNGIKSLDSDLCFKQGLNISLGKITNSEIRNL
jgi:alanine dehydrogenase